MIDVQTTNEQFIVRFYSTIVLNSKKKFKVDYMIDEHMTDEEFIRRFYGNIVLSSKQRFEFDYAIVGETTGG